MGIIQPRRIFPPPPNEVSIPLYHHQLPVPSCAEELSEEGVRVLPDWLALICNLAVPGKLGGAALILVCFVGFFFNSFFFFNS